MKKFLFDCGTRDAAASCGIIFLRIALGLMLLFGHGIPKVLAYESLKLNFYVPEFLPLNPWTHEGSLFACILVQVGASIFMILGYATRPAAFVLGMGAVVVAFRFLGAAPWFQPSSMLVDTKEMWVVYLIALSTIILTGAGSYSVDAAIYREQKRRRW